MSCGVSCCRNRAKCFGVCGVHKKMGYLWDDLQFQRDIDTYRQLVIEYSSECTKLGSAGINILGIQSCWDNNLCGDRVHPFPKCYENVGKIMEQLKSIPLKLQTKYDNYLVYNVCTRINHSILDPTCNCSYCNLGKKSKSV